MSAHRALNRFGLGARPDESRADADPRGWLESQLASEPERRPTPEGTEDPGSLLRAQLAASRTGDEAETREVRRRIGAHVTADAVDGLTARVAADRPFLERWVAFWSNHLCVGAGAKVPTRLLAGAYEREAIRPFVLGPFETLLLEATRHPAMITYLDNVRSVGPDSPAARRRGRRADTPVGLNENHARELLELHTLGVDGGYGQDDVRELARILTGWTVSGLGGAVGALRGEANGRAAFSFEPLVHDPGEKTVLGRRYAESGVAEGEQVIRDLARHPSTARFLATKLVRHFVADDPPAAAVDRLAGRFTETEGDLREVAREVIHLEEAWAPDHLKFRTPQDWLVAVLRGLGLRQAPPTLLGVLRDLRQPLWSPASPKGFDDTTDVWADPDGLLNRAEFARTVARTVSRRSRVDDPVRLAALVEREAGDPLHAILRDDAVATDERVALAFADPRFQWR
ncbi:DUF1800 domain-containing protein [Gaopeijia maritima]|uniref:DUF1800 domain-containing protein n=1 Tax=Gaopeijia maritima TaxID=3119007 RepID=A0ABU9E937_9BACT